MALRTMGLPPAVQAGPWARKFCWPCHLAGPCRDWVYWCLVARPTSRGWPELPPTPCLFCPVICEDSLLGRIPTSRPQGSTAWRNQDIPGEGSPCRWLKGLTPSGCARLGGVHRKDLPSVPTVLSPGGWACLRWCPPSGCGCNTTGCGGWGEA